jgi:hypothetical protein
MSKMALAHKCAYGFRADVETFPRPPGKEARIGTFFHKLVEGHVKGAQFGIGESEEAEEARSRFSAPLITYLDSIPWAHAEIGIVYDSRHDEAYTRGGRGTPGYGQHEDGAIAGTLDLVVIEPDAALVIDAKSGKLVKDREQLYAQAVAVSRAFKVDTVRVGYLYGRKTKCDPPELETLDADRLDHEAGRIARLLRKLPMAEPNPGDHCHFCEAKPGCKAYGASRAEDGERELEQAGYFG